MPPGRNVSQPAAVRRLCSRSWLGGPKRPDADRREQVADRVHRECGRRTQPGDEEATQWRAGAGGRPEGGLKSRVGAQALLVPHQPLEMGAARRGEHDVAGRLYDSHRAQVHVREQTQRSRDRDSGDRREAKKVRPYHHRALAAVLHERAQRQRDCGAGESRDGREYGDLEGGHVQGHHRNQRQCT